MSAREITLEDFTKGAEADPNGYWLPPEVQEGLLLSDVPSFHIAFAPSPLPDLQMLVDLETVMQRRAALEQKSALADNFAARAKELDGVADVQVTDLEPDLVVTIFTDDQNMERDLLLQALFSDETQGLPGTEMLRIRRISDPDSDS